MHTTNRRDFLKLAATAGGGGAARKPKSLYADMQEVPGAVKAWRTSGLAKYQPVQSPPQWEIGKDVSPLAISLDPGTRYQEILGFGGFFTAASSYLMSKMAPDARHALLSDLYGPAGLGLSVGRTCIGTS